MVRGRCQTKAIKIRGLSLRLTAAAGCAVAAALFGLFARCRKHLPAIAALGGLAAVGACDGLVEFFYKLFEALVAGFAKIL